MGKETSGVLVGWTHNDYNGNINLHLQCARSSRKREPKDIDDHYLMMTCNQAAILANYLFELTGQEPTRARQRGFWQRFFGR